MRKGKPLYLYLDQNGSRIFARTLRGLREEAGGGRAYRMYLDKTDGTTVHCGYVIGHRWFTRYAPVEVPI